MLKDTVQKMMVAAMKNGDKELKTVLGGIKSALMNKEIELRGKKEMDEEAEIEVINKLVKQVKESIDTAPADRTETIERLNRELKVYEQFLPEQMSEAEINDTIERVLDKLGILHSATAKNKGAIMKELMPLVKGKADGKLVNQLLARYLI